RSAWRPTRRRARRTPCSPRRTASAGRWGCPIARCTALGDAGPRVIRGLARRPAIGRAPAFAAGMRRASRHDDGTVPEEKIVKSMSLQALRRLCFAMILPAAAMAHAGHAAMQQEEGPMVESERGSGAERAFPRWSASNKLARLDGGFSLDPDGRTLRID